MHEYQLGGCGRVRLIYCPANVAGAAAGTTALKMITRCGTSPSVIMP